MRAALFSVVGVALAAGHSRVELPIAAANPNTVPAGRLPDGVLPEEPGNWLFHCHVAFHTSIFLAAAVPPDPADPITVDPVHGMRGMVLAVTVRPGRSGTRRPTEVAGAREIRLIAQSAPMRFKGVLDEMAFVSQEGGAPPAPDSVPVPSSPLVLERGRPVRITIVNHMRAPTGVHWHGIEVPSYSDGVPHWSGAGNYLAPTIEPGDSFVAAFTPPRSGTFIYHAHANESFQVSLGLYGGLLVVDSARYDPAHERLTILGGNGPAGPGETMDFEYRPAAPGMLRLEVMQRQGLWKTQLPIRVTEP